MGVRLSTIRHAIPEGRGRVMHPAAHLRLRRLLALPSVALLLGLAACGNSPSSSTGRGLGSGAVLVGVIAPFTGADAGLGPAYYAACLPASLTINNNGGVGGRHVSCQKFDTRGEA